MAAAAALDMKNVRVCIRCRPFIEREKAQGHTGQLVTVDEHSNAIRCVRRAALRGAQGRSAPAGPCSLAHALAAHP